SQAGKLEEALALRSEKTRAESGGTVPETDEEGAPESLRALRKTWREQAALLAAQREQSAAPLHAAYDRAHAAYQDERTRAGQLDEAIRVKAVRDFREGNRSVVAEAASAPVASAAPPLSADQILPPPTPATQEEIRSLCE